MGDGQKKLDCQNVAIVVAHPDDETIGCGGQLHRLEGCSVLLVTDGAPADPQDARSSGFATAAAYAQARAQEFFEVMDLAGIDRRSVLRLEVPDQGAAQQLTSLARKIAAVFSDRSIHVAVTHAFEGGHPDHDAVAFAVHEAQKVLRRLNGPIGELDIIEMPLYRVGPGGMLLQSFAPAVEGCEICIKLDAPALALKRRMIERYRTQQRLLSLFSSDVELFRLAQEYDFSEFPNGGHVFYETQPWGLNASRWCALASASLQELSSQVLR